MKILGSYGTEGNYVEFTTPTEVVQLGNTLRDTDDGMICGVKDEYGDWVSPHMRRIGVKHKLEVTD